MKAPKSKAALEKQWATKAAKLLVGKKIVSVGYLHKDNLEEMDWYRAPIVITLEDGTSIYPSQDDEGNGPGSLFTTSETLPIIPVI
jgi:hypothetical protein